MIVDGHAHVFLGLAGTIGRGAVQPLPYGKARLGNGDVLRVVPPLAVETCFPAEVLLEYMDWTKVDRAVLLQGPFYGEANEYVRTVVEKWPDRFIGAALVDPLAPLARETLDRVVDEMGFRVIKLDLSEQAGLTGVYGEFNLADPHLSWLWKAANRHHLTVALDLGAVGSRSYQTPAMRRLIELYPDIRWVLTHLGWPSPCVRVQPELESAWIDQISLANHANVWLDLAALPAFFPDEEYPYPSIRYFVGRAAEMVGAERLIWGTDVPGLLKVLTYRQLLDVVLNNCDCFSPTDQELVLGTNALLAYG